MSSPVISVSHLKRSFKSGSGNAVQFVLLYAGLICQTQNNRRIPTVGHGGFLLLGRNWLCRLLINCILVICGNRIIGLSLTYRFGGYKAKQHEEVDTSRFGK